MPAAVRQTVIPVLARVILTNYSPPAVSLLGVVGLTRRHVDFIMLKMHVVVKGDVWCEYILVLVNLSKNAALIELKMCVWVVRWQT